MSQTGASVTRWIEMDQLKGSILSKSNVFDRQNGSDLSIKGGKTRTSSTVTCRQGRRNNSSRTPSSPRARHPRGSKPLAVSLAKEQSCQSPPSRGASSHRLPNRAAKPSVASKPWSEQSPSPQPRSTPPVATPSRGASRQPSPSRGGHLSRIEHTMLPEASHSHPT